MSLPERLLTKRREMGWSIKEAANSVGIDPGTWGNWERGHKILYGRHREQIARMLGLSADALDQQMGSRWNRSHARAL